MTNAKELLALSDEELGLEAARILMPGPWEHSTFVDFEGTYHKIYKCHKCDESFAVKDATDEDICSVPTPINVTDWRLAMEWVRKCDRHSFSDTFEEVFCQTHESQSVGRMWWMQFYAQPRHYIIAAMLAEGAKEVCPLNTDKQDDIYDGKIHGMRP